MVNMPPAAADCIDRLREKEVTSVNFGRHYDNSWCPSLVRKLQVEVSVAHQKNRTFDGFTYKKPFSARN